MLTAYGRLRWPENIELFIGWPDIWSGCLSWERCFPCSAEAFASLRGEDENTSQTTCLEKLLKILQGKKRQIGKIEGKK